VYNSIFFWSRQKAEDKVYSLSRPKRNKRQRAVTSARGQ